MKIEVGGRSIFLNYHFQFSSIWLVKVKNLQLRPGIEGCDGPT